MSDNEIIKALECCSLIQGECKECPCNSVMDCDCEDMLLREAFYLINRQKAEIERLKTNLKEAHIDIREHIARIESLKKANEEMFADISRRYAEIESLKNAYKQCAWERDVFAKEEE